MRKPRVYVDTSVFGGACDDEFAAQSARFFEQVRKGLFVVVVSRMVIREIRAAPDKVKRVLTSLPSESVEFIDIDDDVVDLADAYVASGILTSASRDDAVHVAAAAVAGASLLLSWNFKHIVNYNRIHQYNAINLMKGYAQIEIHSPLEMDDEGEDKII